MSDPYFEDEFEDSDSYYYDDDAWFEDHYMGGQWYVHKAENGQLYAVEVSLWQEDTTQPITSTSESHRLTDLTRRGRAACIRVGIPLKPGDSKEFDITDQDNDCCFDDDDFIDDDDDDESEYHGTFENPGNTALPADYIPF